MTSLRARLGQFEHVRPVIFPLTFPKPRGLAWPLMTLYLRAVSILTFALAAGPVPAAVTFSLDFSLDEWGLFDARTADGRAAQAAIQRAAQVLSDRLVDRLAPVAPAAGDVWSPRIINPGTGLDVAAPGLTSLPAGAIKLYVGSRPLGLPDVANAVAGFGSATGSAAFTTAIAARGQAGALTTPKTDYGPWGGSIAFDIDTPWHLGLSAGTLTANKMDLLTLAVHEIAHLLGFSTGNPSYAARVSAESRFTGPRAVAANNNVAPPVNGSHWANVTSKVGPAGPAQLAVMNPAVPTGVRRRLTLIDWAALDDIGWDLAFPGDANADGVVSFADLQILELNFGTTANARWAQGDFDEDGDVDRADYYTAVDNYGHGWARPPTAADPAPEPSEAVPEPIAGAFLGLATLLATRPRRR
jgi:hypothetical protein